MSDALTDIARDQERARAFNAFLEKLTEYLSKPTKAAQEVVLKYAQDTDAVTGGYWTGKTNLASFVQDNLEGLVQQDKKAWAKILKMVLDSPFYYQLKDMSPFRSKVMLIIDYGIGFVTFGGEIEDWAYRLLRQEGHKTYEGDTYAVFIPEEALAGCEIAHLNRKAET
jgi:hypothetical protein